MANISLNDFPSAGAYSGLESVDTFYYWDESAGEPRKLSLAELVLYVLGGKVIGGTSAGDLVTINATQTLTGKSLTTPGVNGAAITTATGAEINHCAGVTSAIQTQLNAKAPTASPTFTGTVVLPSTTSIGTVTSTKIGYLAGVSSDIQTQLNALFAQLPSPLTSVYNYALTFTTGGAETSKTITQSTLLVAAGLTESAYAIDPASVVISLYKNDGISKREKLIVGTGSTDGEFVINTKVVGGVTQVQDVKLSALTAATQYSIALFYKVLNQSATT